MTSRADVAKMIDHTLLKPEATSDQVKALIAEAGKLGTYSICISPSQLPVEVPEGLHIATVVGFPSGAVKAEIKAAEAARAVADGAEEVDMVINIAFAKEHRFDDLEAEIKAVRDAIPGKILKVIIESAALTDEEIIAACKASESAGADFVKTSTGFHPAGGASAHAVKLMRETVGDRLGVKASGGIRDAAAAEEMIAAGASRLGLSSSAAVLDGLK
ncbi:deoxyribose-phosphate aldolase [Corynebacterium amycolatum]|uniref:Deoxyribose-phosphate aldolase n=1 Tax=Corynebacterium amycolatum TaxID=43765 RepID=A0AAW9SZB8_CORAY|nr:MULTISPECIES: deoxyribose-phosphate aldolase [Corynebacterium]KAA0881593.1 deoxyribose-phosphate aldolase [Corynebacterium amycolatum]MDK7237788.1 deoxyribose-phosphate aldolase [Corynebacterium amycolatum]MDK7247798.1 deoxyribose-phosphate aldolase [Corynebacterium amycolatum]OFM53428.1 2-deoxyribose-5-phosphate aldolase [Corynebacterium sp. HMSC064H12]OFQ01499.1 2-deoxyribose-5-phosphate aldolase [Corynebacterium sp. HMSC070B05]